MLELAKSHSEITVVYDEVGTPTYTPDLAYGISQLIETDKYGIYHLTNSGSCSWCEFSRLIFEIAGKDVKVIPVTASEFARPAPRPSYSVLENKNWKDNGFKPLRNYKEAIKEYIELIK
jgi:dTDP-4-dehydrorhamnose reductase